MAKVNRTVLHELVPMVLNFKDGGTVREYTDLVLQDGDGLYQYTGTLPYTFSAGTKPTGSNWVPVSDVTAKAFVQVMRKLCVYPDLDYPTMTDDAALSAAIGTGKPVVLTARKYKLTKPLELMNATKMYGAGKTKTVIECSTETSGMFSDYGFNIQLRGFRLDGLNSAKVGIRLGSQRGISAHHILDDIQVHDFTSMNVHVIKGIYHHFTDSVYLTGGTGFGLYTESMDVSTIEGRYYNHSKGSVYITNSSNFNTFKGKVYNDIDYPSDYLMVVDSSCGNNIGFDFEPQGVNNVKASLLLDRVTGTPWKPSNISDNYITGKFLGVTKTSTEAHIVLGGTTAAYKTIIDRCVFLTLQNDLPDIKLVRQNDTRVSKSVQNLTYDTPVLKEVKVLNVGGDPYIHEKFRNERTGSFVPSVKTTLNQPVITGTGSSAGYYHLVGNRCFIDVWVDITLSSTGTGSVQIHGLPFTQKAGSQFRAVLSVGIRSVQSVGGHVAEGGNHIELTSGTGGLLSTELGTSFKLRASCSYLVQ